MPYLRSTCPELPREQRREMARRLTDAVNDIFYNPRAPVTRDELREHTTVHFVPYGDDELFIGARTPAERGTKDITVELPDWHMSEKRQRKAARVLTPLLGELFGVPESERDGINIRFHPYPPKDFAVGGKLLADRVPGVPRLLKRIFG